MLLVLAFCGIAPASGCQSWRFFQGTTLIFPVPCSRARASFFSSTNLSDSDETAEPLLLIHQEGEDPSASGRAEPIFLPVCGSEKSHRPPDHL